MTQVDMGFPLTMEVEIEKVWRATSMELATIFAYFGVMLTMEEVPLVEVMMRVLL